MQTIVVLEGDQTGQELLEESLRVLSADVVGVELHLPRFDLSLESRRDRQSCGLRRGGCDPRARIRPRSRHGSHPRPPATWGSPNRILREEIGGGCQDRPGNPGCRPLAGVHAPISVVRMAVCDAYRGKERREGEGDNEVALRTERIERRIWHAVAEFSFRQAERMGAKSSADRSTP